MQDGVFGVFGGVWARLSLVRFIIAGSACYNQKKPDIKKFYRIYLFPIFACSNHKINPI